VAVVGSAWTKWKEEFVIFCDDHSFVDPGRMERLHDLIVQQGIRKRYFAYAHADCIARHPRLFEKWARIGLQMVMTGLEAVDDARIGAFDKRSSADVNEQAIRVLERCGIGLSAGFVVTPDFAQADFERIETYVRERPVIQLAELTPLTPLPGTDLHAQQREVLTEHRELYDLAHFVVPTRLPARELYRLLRACYLRVMWRAFLRLRLYRPRYALKPHMPRLLAGALRNAALLGRAHLAAQAAIPRDM